MAIAYFDCFSGIAGDMTLAALIDAGADTDAIVRQVRTLGLDDFRLLVTKEKRSGISATRVKVEHEDQHHHRHFTHIVKMIESAALSPAVKERAIAVFRKLGEAEAKMHDVPLEKVHFHEVGAVDSIVDVVGSVVAMELLSIEAFYTTPLTLGTGMAFIDHGVVMVPVPATVELLKGIPIRQSAIEAELVTPTGAALVAALSSGLLPDRTLTTTAVGYGAGSRENPGLPNLLRVRIGVFASDTTPERIVLLETNIDDMNQEFYPYIIEKVLADGALDAYLTPIIGKKGRPGHILTVMCREAAVQQFTETMFRETSTAGIRVIPVDRRTLPRELTSVQTEFGPIAAKRIYSDGRVRVTPEFEDCRRVAKEQSLPLAVVYDAVLRAAHESPA